MVDPKLEQVKILMILEASSWEAVQQSSGYWEEAFRVELTYYQFNTKGISLVRYNLRAMTCVSREG